MDNKDLVSVIIPVYNARDFIYEAVNSILAQTYKNIEIVIVDDASTDGTGEILREIKNKYHERINLVCLKKNKGKGGDSAANVAFQKARGNYVARMDADDVALPDRIEKQVKFLKENPEYSVVGTSAYVIDTTGEVVGEKIMPETHDVIYKNCFEFHPMINPTQMFNVEKLKNKKELYMTDNPTNNDYLTTMRRVSHGAKYYNLPEKLLYYRIHDKNDSLARVRSTFRNSLRTRLRAVFDFGYKPSILSIAKLSAQIILVYTLPERLVFTIYILVRGIVKPSVYLRSLQPRFLGKLKKAPDSA